VVQPDTNMSSNHIIEPLGDERSKSVDEMTTEQTMLINMEGQRVIRDGLATVVVLAGGQGTRLGFDHPKGMYRLPKLMNKSIF